MSEKTKQDEMDAALARLARTQGEMREKGMESAPGLRAGALAGGGFGASAPEPIMQFFTSAHLPEHLRAVSAPFEVMAHRIVETLPRNAERTVALRKLLESKDAAVRALIAK